MGCRGVRVNIERLVKEAIAGNYLPGQARDDWGHCEIIFVVESIGIVVEFFHREE